MSVSPWAVKSEMHRRRAFGKVGRHICAGLFVLTVNVEHAVHLMFFTVEHGGARRAQGSSGLGATTRRGSKEARRVRGVPGVLPGARCVRRKSREAARGRAEMLGSLWRGGAAFIEGAEAAVRGGGLRPGRGRQAWWWRVKLREYGEFFGGGYLRGWLA